MPRPKHKNSVGRMTLLKYRLAGKSIPYLFPCASHPVVRISAALLDGVPSKTPVCRQVKCQWPEVGGQTPKGCCLCCASFVRCRLCFLLSLSSRAPRIPGTLRFTTAL